MTTLRRNSSSRFKYGEIYFAAAHIYVVYATCLNYVKVSCQKNKNDKNRSYHASNSFSSQSAVVAVRFTRRLLIFIYGARFSLNGKSAKRSKKHARCKRCCRLLAREYELLSLLLLLRFAIPPRWITIDCRRRETLNLNNCANLQ